MSTEHKVSKDDVERMYNEVKFEVMSEGFEYINKQILDPAPTCVLCQPKKVQSERVTIRGVRFNDHSSKTQTIFSACEECCEKVRKLKDLDIELDETQRIMRLLFPKSSDKLMNHMFMAKKLNEYPPIYVEYMGALKWAVEEKLVRQLMNALPVEQTEGYTTAIPKKEDDQLYETVQLYSPFKECWYGIHLEQSLARQVNLDLQGVEYEVRTMYFDDYKDYQDKPKRESLELLCKGMVHNKNRVLFIDTAIKVEDVQTILGLLGCDEEHSIIQRMTDGEVKDEESKQDEEKDDNEEETSS